MIYLTGTLVTCRDVLSPPFDRTRTSDPLRFNGKAIFHAGPIVRKNGDKWRWSLVGRQPVCVWKVLNVNLLSRPA
ncbi:hypothetical protein ACVXG9_28820 [Escherichia coli]